jgi:hypothetical protein
MVAEPLLPEVKAQDGNSIGNSIEKEEEGIKFFID